MNEQEVYTVDVEVWSGSADPDHFDDLLDLLADLGATAVVGHSSGAGYGARFCIEAVDDVDAFVRGRELFLAALDKAGLDHETVAHVEVLDDRYAELEFDRPADPLVGVTEVAEMLGVTRQRASELRTREGFPAPIADLASGPVWKSSSLRRFTETWERRPGRPRRKTTKA